MQRAWRNVDQFEVGHRDRKRRATRARMQAKAQAMQAAYNAANPDKPYRPPFGGGTRYLGR